MIKRNGDNVFAIASSNQCQGARPAAVSLCPAGATRIPRATVSPAAAPTTAVRMTPPDAHHNTKEANIALSTYVEKWKNRYEEAERKHKASLLKSEKGKREYDDLHRRHSILQEEHSLLSRTLAERERSLAELRTASERLFLEYQALRNQQDVDQGVMHKVMAQAGEWYKQNKQLKRRSTVLMQALPAKGVDIDFTDSNDTASDTSSNEEVEFLKQTVSELSRDLASLQSQLSQARLQEFEAQETNVGLAQELETCQSICKSQESELGSLREQAARHERVARLLVDEVSAIKENADKERELCENYKSEARAAKKRVKVLAHQSALLAGDLDLDSRLLALLAEVEKLRAALEDRDQRHRDQVEQLELKLAEKHEDTDILLWEEKIKLAEEDARKATDRAELAEKKLTDAERKLTDVANRLTDSERKLTEVGSKLKTIDSKFPNTTSKLTDAVKLTEAVKLTDAVKLTSPVKLSEIVKPKRSNLMSRISYFEAGANVDKKNVEDRIEEVIEAPQQTRIPSPTEPNPPVSTTPELSTPPEDSPALETDVPPPKAEATPQVNEPPAFIPPPPPCMPPPPPPPPPPPVASSAGGEDMASMLASKQGTLRRNKQNAENGGGAIDAIVDQIKGGKFHLKSRDSTFIEKKKEEQPEAVKEMLSILGTLRKRRPTVVPRPAVDYTDF